MDRNDRRGLLQGSLGGVFTRDREEQSAKAWKQTLNLHLFAGPWC